MTTATTSSTIPASVGRFGATSDAFATFAAAALSCRSRRSPTLLRLLLHI